MRICKRIKYLSLLFMTIVGRRVLTMIKRDNHFSIKPIVKCSAKKILISLTKKHVPFIMFILNACNVRTNLINSVLDTTVRCNGRNCIINLLRVWM